MRDRNTSFYVMWKKRKKKPRIIQVEKVLKQTTKTECPKYCPPEESIKKLYYVAYDLQFDRGRRLGLRVPIYFMSALLPEDREIILSRLAWIRAWNGLKAKEARLKRRRFYNRSPLQSTINWVKTLERRGGVYDECE